MVRRKVKRDTKQTTLGGDSDVKPPVKVEFTLGERVKYRCPFCFHFDYMYRFEVPVKAGVSKKSAKCPDCGFGMRMESLTMDISVKEYARWLYDYIVNYRGYDRISWDKLKKRLKDTGIAKEFWDEWHKHKAEHWGGEDKAAGTDWRIRKDERVYSDEELEKMYKDYEQGEKARSDEELSAVADLHTIDELAKVQSEKLEKKMQDELVKKRREAMGYTI